MKQTLLYLPFVFMAILASGYRSDCNAQFTGKKWDFPVKTKALSEKLSTSSLLFTENRGQVADAKGTLRPDILFTAHSGGAQLFLTANSIHYQFTKTDYPAGYEQDERSVHDHEKQDALRKEIKTVTHRFTVSLAGANPSPHIRKEEKNSYTENFYLAHCPQGITGVNTFSRLVYENVYPGIDWVIYSNGSGMKYDFLVHPGADYKAIRLKVSDADVRISESGELVMKTSLGEVREKKPVSFSGSRHIETDFVQHGGNEFGFCVAAYDNNNVLTIDPAIVWSTYYGGELGDYIYAISTTKSGVSYVAGETFSMQGFAFNGFLNVRNGYTADAHLVKFDPNGTRIWATYYGGERYDIFYACVADDEGRIYASGYTESTTGVAFNGHQNSLSGINERDGLLVRFSESGARVWGSYYGGAGGQDMSHACAEDAAGNVYVAGYSWASTGIAYNGFQNTVNGTDAFLAKFSSDGIRMWGTYFGGSGADYAYACATDAAGHILIAGRTSSPDVIGFNGFQNSWSGINEDGFLACFDTSGNRLWSTYYGGLGADAAYACKTDQSGHIYLAGITSSVNNINFQGFQSSYGGGNFDAFVARFDTAGNRIWSTYYGGPGYDGGLGLTIDAVGNLFVAGSTSSVSGLSWIGPQNSYGGGTYDAFCMKLTPAGYRTWASYFGGSLEDVSGAISWYKGSVFLAGHTKSLSGIAANGFQNAYGGGNSDGFVTRIFDTLFIPTSIPGKDIPLHLIIYPNPSAGFFTLEGQWAGSSSSLDLALYSVTGQKVFSSRVWADKGHFKIPVALSTTLTNGLYQLRISAGDVQAMKPLLLQR